MSWRVFLNRNLLIKATTAVGIDDPMVVAMLHVGGQLKTADNVHDTIEHSTCLTTALPRHGTGQGTAGHKKGNSFTNPAFQPLVLNDKCFQLHDVHGFAF